MTTRGDKPSRPIRGRARPSAPVDPRKARLALAGILVGAVGALTGLFTPPAVYYVPGGLAVVTIVLVVLAWPAKPRVWFALILAGMALAETLYGYTAVQQSHEMTSAPPSQSRP